MATSRERSKPAGNRKALVAALRRAVTTHLVQANAGDDVRRYRSGATITAGQQIGLAALLGQPRADLTQIRLRGPRDGAGRDACAAAQAHERALGHLAPHRQRDPSRSLATWLAEDVVRAFEHAGLVDAAMALRGTPDNRVAAVLRAAPAVVAGRTTAADGLAAAVALASAALLQDGTRWARTGGLAPLTKRAAADLMRAFPWALPDHVAAVHAAASRDLDDVVLGWWHRTQADRDAHAVAATAAGLADLTAAAMVLVGVTDAELTPRRGPVPAMTATPPDIDHDVRERIIADMANHMEHAAGTNDPPARRDEPVMAPDWTARTTKRTVIDGRSFYIAVPTMRPVLLDGAVVTGRDIEAAVGGATVDPADVAAAAALVTVEDVAALGRHGALRAALAAHRHAPGGTATVPGWWRPGDAQRLRMDRPATAAELESALAEAARLARGLWCAAAVDRLAAVARSIQQRRLERDRVSAGLTALAASMRASAGAGAGRERVAT